MLHHKEVNWEKSFDYALNKNQGESNFGKFLYVGTGGEVALMTIDDLKTLLDA